MTTAVLAPRKMTFGITLPRDLLQNSPGNIETTLGYLLAEAAASNLDRMFLLPLLDGVVAQRPAAADCIAIDLSNLAVALAGHGIEPDGALVLTAVREGAKLNKHSLSFATIMSSVLPAGTIVCIQPRGIGFAFGSVIECDADEGTRHFAGGGDALWQRPVLTAKLRFGMACTGCGRDRFNWSLAPSAPVLESRVALLW